MALTFRKGSESGRFIAATDDLTYLVVKHDKRWWLSVYDTATLKDVERIEAHDTKRLAVAVANAYAEHLDGFVPAQHGGKNLMTVAVLEAYKS